MRTAAGVNADYRAALPRFLEYSKSLEGPSLAEQLVALPEAKRRRILDSLTPPEFLALKYCWRFWAKPKQLAPPGTDWRWWLYQGGRGSGKSRAAQEWLRERVEQGAEAIAIGGPTMGHIYTYMVEGNRGAPGLLDVFPESQRPKVNSKDNVINFHTGAIGYLLTAEEAEQRGGNFDTAWIDEAGKTRNIVRFFRNISRALRTESLPPQGVVTTNPPDEETHPEQVRWLKGLALRESVITVIGSTDDNRAHLAKSYIREIEEEFEGSDLEDRERRGLLGEGSGVRLFSADSIDVYRWRGASLPRLKEVAVCVDPAASDSERADTVGIIGVGLGHDDDVYPCADRSGKMDPKGYGDEAVDLFFELQRIYRGADAFLLVEDSKFGKHVKHTIRTAIEQKRGTLAADAIRIDEVTAVGDKATRAHPVSALYRRGRVHHVGDLRDLEDELTGWRPGKKSPGRLDALVHGVIKLARLEADPEPDLAPMFVGLAEAQKAMPAPPFARAMQRGAFNAEEYDRV